MIKNDIRLLKLISKESRCHTMDNFMQHKCRMGINNYEIRFVVHMQYMKCVYLYAWACTTCVITHIGQLSHTYASTSCGITHMLDN